ncbi:MAG: FAD-binding oxidoreductase [Bacteroidetes bacterium]|nr:FAD-binding oxidoreductase [Bacteroidota bacterium]
MKEVDYIVIGLGIAGLSFCEQLERHDSSFMVFDSSEHTATTVAGGVVNPVVLKRFTLAWGAADFLKEATTFYQHLSKRLETTFFSEIDLHRILANPQEQNDWLVASDKVSLSSFLSTSLITESQPGVLGPFGFGTVKQALRVDTQKLVDAFKKQMIANGRLHSERFDYDKLQITPNGVIYKNLSAKRIVFAEGAQVLENPFFTVEALVPKKGEYIIIKSKELQLDSVLKGPYFIIPLGDDLYKIGATFAHGDTTYDVTSKGKTQLMEAVSKILNCPYTVEHQVAGIRPTVKDRRPLLGALSKEPIYFFNGLGARGLLMAPKLSNMIYDHIETGLQLPNELSIRRFL